MLHISHAHPACHGLSWLCYEYASNQSSSPLCCLLVEACPQIVIVCQQKKKHLMILLWMSIMITTCEDKTRVHIMIIKCSVMKNLLDLCRGVNNLFPRLLVVGEGERHPHPLCSTQYTVCSTVRTHSCPFLSKTCLLVLQSFNHLNHHPFDNNSGQLYLSCAPVEICLGISENCQFLNLVLAISQ